MPNKREEQTFEQLIKDAVLKEIQFSAHSYLGHMNTGLLWQSVIALFAATLNNPNLVASESSPRASELERQNVEDLAAMLGYPQGSSPQPVGFQNSGGSSGNYSALLQALYAKTAPLSLKLGLNYYSNQKNADAFNKLIDDFFKELIPPFTAQTEEQRKALANIVEDTIPKLLKIEVERNARALHKLIDDSLKELISPFTAQTEEQRKALAQSIRDALQELLKIERFSDQTSSGLSKAQLLRLGPQSWRSISKGVSEAILKQKLVENLERAQPKAEALLEALKYPFCIKKLGTAQWMQEVQTTFGGGLIDFRIYVSEASHYSLEKGARLLGLGTDSICKVRVSNDQCMDIAELKRHIQEDLKNKKVPLLIGVTTGTTELGSIEPLDQVLELTKKLSLDVWVHADAAYGGYFASMLRPKPGSEKQSLHELLKEEAQLICADLLKSELESQEQENLFKRQEKILTALADADSISLDPHKLGFVPYACGMYLFKNKKDSTLLSGKRSPYLWHGEQEQVETGLLTIEGSRAGAYAHAIHAAIQQHPLHQGGHGRLMARTWIHARILKVKLIESFTELFNENNENLRLAFLPVQTNMLCYFLYQPQQTIEEAMQITQAVADALHPTTGETIFNPKYHTEESTQSHTGEPTQSSGEEQPYPITVISTKIKLGLKAIKEIAPEIISTKIKLNLEAIEKIAPEIEKSEPESEGAAQVELFFLRSVLMNPDLSLKEIKNLAMAFAYSVRKIMAKKNKSEVTDR